MPDTITVYNARTITTTFRNNLDAPTNPSSVTFTLTAPTGTVTTPSATNTATGIYAVTVYFNIAGRWKYGWKTDSAFGVNVEDYMDVTPSYFE